MTSSAGSTVPLNSSLTCPYILLVWCNGVIFLSARVRGNSTTSLPIHTSIALLTYNNYLPCGSPSNTSHQSILLQIGTWNIYGVQISLSSQPWFRWDFGCPHHCPRGIVSPPASYSMSLLALAYSACLMPDSRQVRWLFSQQQYNLQVSPLFWCSSDVNH